ncbi:MAG: type II toxin-antitoxin system VapC family toxin [Anaerolineae bacterium]
MPNSEALESAYGRPSIVGDILILDSNEYIFGFADPHSDSADLLKAIKDYVVIVPAIVVQEVTSNLAAISSTLPRMFYGLLNDPSVHMVRSYDEPPEELWLKYLDLGLSEEDAFIGGFAEWVGAKFLVSENRDFLRELKTEAFEVVDASMMLQKLEQGEVTPAESIIE